MIIRMYVYHREVIMTRTDSKSVNGNTSFFSFRNHISTPFVPPDLENAGTSFSPSVLRQVPVKIEAIRSPVSQAHRDETGNGQPLEAQLDGLGTTLHPTVNLPSRAVKWNWNLLH